MHLPFATSARGTLGIEWELALVDRQTGDLRSVADTVLERARADMPELAGGGEHPFVKQELLQNTVEVVTDICHTVQEGVEQLRDTAQAVMRYCDPLDVDFYCQGSHPFAHPTQQPVTNKERYNEMISRTQWWGRQMVIYGVHVHVGLNDVSYAMPAVNALCNYNAHFQALSASSPFWAGEDTGYASQRALMFQQLPTAGTGYQFDHWSGYERCVGDLTHTGVVEHITEVRWDVRAVPHLGTVEQRVCDGLSTLDEIGAIAALTQCLVIDTLRRIDRGGTVQVMPPWYIQENKWRAARYGLDAIIILNTEGDEELVTDHLARELDRLEPLAAELGCANELRYVETMMQQAGYQRQRKIADHYDGDLRQVVLDAAARTHASIAGGGAGEAPGETPPRALRA